MSWKKLQAEGKVHVHKTSKKELDDLRAVIVRDLEDAAIQELSDDRRFATAYNAALQTAKMAIACAGYRLASTQGHHRLSLANCYFAHNSSGFPVLLRFYDAQFGLSFHPLHRHTGPVARTWRRPFPSCGVASPQAPAPHRESLPATIAESIRVGPRPCRLDGALGASNSSAPFRNCTEALDTASSSQSYEQAKVPDAVLHESPSEARPERIERRTRSCGRRNEAA